MISFEEFKDIVREGEVSGEIKTSIPLTDYDLAVQWAIGSIGERKGYPCEVTSEEIWQEMYPLFEDKAQEMADFLNSLTKQTEREDE